MSHNAVTFTLSDLRLDTAHALVMQLLGGDLPRRLDAQQPLAYLQSLIDGLCELSLKDPLTGLFNRRHLYAALGSEIDRVTRSGDSALLLIIDIDHFKRVNDTYGHLVGDLALQTVGRTLQTCLRPMDTIARYGGEEFAIVLPACEVTYGRAIAERLRRAVESASICASHAQSLNVTVSIGGAFAQQWSRNTAARWVERADAELYKAKHGGRNRISIEEQPDSAVSVEEKMLLGVNPPPRAAAQTPIDNAF